MGCFVTHPTVGHIVGINEMITDPAFKSRIPGNAELQLGIKRGYSVKLGTHRTALQSLCHYERSLGTNISVSGFQIPQEAVECRCWC